MPKQHPTNSGSEVSRLRAALALAGEPLRGAFWAVEDRVVWGGRDVLRRVFDLVRWPFERLAWTTEQRLVWPLRERTAGWSAPARAAGGGALAAAAIGAVALGAVLVATGGNGGATSETVATAELSATKSSSRASQPPSTEPVLQGAPPALGVDGAVATTKAPAKEATAAPVSEDASVPASGATASSSKAVPAGPEAMKVARRFAEAFVVYEVGERPARARAAFDETATPELAGALAKRPPRLPEKVKVPRAKVVNLVPGPRRGRAYTVSVSLLRVGVTNELRLELRKNTAGWLVSDVRG